jgi:phage terminase large subunit-like protein
MTAKTTSEQIQDEITRLNEHHHTLDQSCGGTFPTDALKAANPSFGDFQSATELRAMAEDARRMASREAQYRNLLNKRAEAINPCVSKAVWDENARAVAECFAGHPVYAGLDLSEVSDFTALVLAAEIDGVWHVKTDLLAALVGVARQVQEKSGRYDLWHQQGHLQASPERVIDTLMSPSTRTVCSLAGTCAISSRG